MYPAYAAPLANLVNAVFTLINLLIILRIVLSWVHPDPTAPPIRAIYQISEPLLAPFRNLLPTGMGLDFSPLLAILVYSLLRQLILGLLI